MVVENGATFTVSPTNLLTVNSNLFTFGNTYIAASAGAAPGKATVTGSLYVGSTGILRMLTPNNDKPSGSLITNGTVLGTGLVKMDRYYTVSNSWQQVGVPLANQSTTLFTQNTPSGNYNANFYSYNQAYEFATDPADANYSNWNTTTAYWNLAQPAGLNNGVNMNVGTGYFYYNEGDVTVNLSSVATDLTTGNKDITLSYNSNDNDWDGTPIDNFGKYYDGWNFISNPYPSAIDWSTITKANLDATAYFWNGTTGNYDYVTATSLWGAGQTVGATGLTFNEIPAMQGFFVHLSGAVVDDEITLGNSNRVHSSQALHKDNVTADFDFVKLQAENNGLTDEAMVGFFADATSNFEGSLDAFKRFANNDIPMIYTISDDQFPLALNALKNEKVNKTVKLGYQSNISGTNTISLIDSKFSNCTVSLIDLYENKTIDLSKSNYIFDFVAGDIQDRFELFFDYGTTNISECITNSELNIKVYPNPTNSILYFSSKENLQNMNITICDISGRIIKNEQVTNNQINVSNIATGIYTVKIETDKGTKITKFIKQ